MMQENIEDLTLTDRDPRFDDTSVNPISQFQENTEEYKRMTEAIQKFQTFGRKQRRKIIKPTFSNSVRKAFKK